ncbi:MAG: hypothetical protein MUC73_01280 [Cyclobacteriaceae bacterium]|nr:hypothetical protein [Cyclobacteriaceae bacterium]
MKRFGFILQSPILWLWVGSILGYNINKFYLRFLSMEMHWYRLFTDVLPNFLIVIIAYLTAVLVRSFELVKNYNKLYDYGILLFFALLLTVEESTGFLGMSKVSDLNDTIASFSAVLIVILANEAQAKKN